MMYSVIFFVILLLGTIHADIVLLDDQFDSNENAWQIDNKYSMINDGNLIIKSDLNSEKHIYCERLELPQDGISIESSFTKIAGDDSTVYGIIIAGKDNKELIILFNGNCQLKVYLKTNNNLNLLFKKDESLFIHPGNSSNILKTILKRGALEIYMNSFFISKIDNIEISPHKTGIYASNNIELKINYVRICSEKEGFLMRISKKPLLIEDFTDNRNKWDTYKTEREEEKIENGFYKIKFKHDIQRAINPQCNSFQMPVLKPISIEANCRLISGSNLSGYGITFAARDVENTYLFEINGSSDYLIAKTEKGMLRILVPWTKNTAIKPDKDENKITIIINNNKILFYVNDKFLHLLEGFSPRGGKIGFRVNGFMEMHIDKVVVSTLEYRNEDIDEK